MSINVHDAFPVGTIVQYLGGNTAAESCGIEYGQEFEIIDHDFLSHFGAIALFEVVVEGVDWFFAIYSEGNLDNTSAFLIVS